MKIAFFGSSLVSSYWNGAATYYRGLLKSLARLGHQITFYEPDAYERQQHRDIDDPVWARVVVYPATEAGWRTAVEAAVGDCDLLVKASGVGVFDTELENAISACGCPSLITVFWDVDAPATLDTVEGSAAHHMRAAVPRFDMVLTYGGGEPVVSAYRRLGARECVPIYNALDPETHFPVPPRLDFACDLSLLANRLPDREARIEAFFFTPATRLQDRTFLLGGSGWAPRHSHPNVRTLGHVGTADHNAFFGSATATLNVNRDSMARYGFSPPTRIFEAAGAGACLITDAWIGLEQFLAPGEEIFIAHDGGEVADILAALTPDRRREVAQAARKRVLSEHTYAHRALEVQRLLDLGSKREAAA